MGETQILLKDHFLEHLRKISVVSEVSQHVHMDRSEHGVSLDKVKRFTVENRKGGVKKAMYIHVVKLSLNKDGSHYLFSAVWTDPLRAIS